MRDELLAATKANRLLRPAVISMVRAVIEAMVISRIISASMVVIIFVSEIVIAVSGSAWRVIHRFTARSDGETLRLRFVWGKDQQSQYPDHKEKKIFHRVLILN